MSSSPPPPRAQSGPAQTGPDQAGLGQAGLGQAEAVGPAVAGTQAEAGGVDERAGPGGVGGGGGSGDMLQGVLFAGGMIMLTALLLRSYLKRRKRTGRGPEAARHDLLTRAGLNPQGAINAGFEPMGVTSAATAVSARVDRSMADAARVARELAAAMDNRAVRIELLLDEADRRLELLAASPAAAAGLKLADAGPMLDDGLPPSVVAQRVGLSEPAVELLATLRLAGRGRGPTA